MREDFTDSTGLSIPSVSISDSGLTLGSILTGDGVTHGTDHGLTTRGIVHGHMTHGTDLGLMTLGIAHGLTTRGLTGLGRHQ